MPRKPNYDHDKRRKELDRKSKQEAKRLEREQRRSERTEPEDALAPEPPVGGSADAPA